MLFALLILGLESLDGGQNIRWSLDPNAECPKERASVFSNLTFTWMTPFLNLGYQQYLSQDQLWKLRTRDTANETSQQLRLYWDREIHSVSGKPSLWRAMMQAFGRTYFKAAVIKTISDILVFIQPQLLRLFINWVNSYRSRGKQSDPMSQGLLLALGMFFTAMMQSICIHQYFFRVFVTGMRMRSSLVAMIYSKSLLLSQESKGSKSVGEIVNHMAVDTQRIEDFTQWGQQLWSAPFQIILCLVSLFQLLGSPVFVGLSVILVSSGINGVLAKEMERLQKTQMKNKDARTRLMTEILGNMKNIKLFAWQKPFADRVTRIRNDLELKTLRKIGILSALQSMLWSGTPILVSAATLTVFVLTSETPLTADLVFPCLTLFSLLSFPMTMLPATTAALVEATVAVNRLTEFLTTAEMQSDGVIRESNIDSEAVVFENATFTWNRADPEKCLANIDFVAKKGQLCCVVGQVGSGKSSLLQSMLGELWRLEGRLIMRGSISYVSQQAWVMNGTVRDNIVFGNIWDQKLYGKTLEACALLPDLAQMPQGDMTHIGEAGMALSGGQRARLALARAVYAGADIYLLDDVLSAVDQHVGRHIIDNILSKKGLLASKTRILATHSIPILRHADDIAVLRNGRIIQRGTYLELLEKSEAFADLINVAGTDEPKSFNDQKDECAEREDSSTCINSSSCSEGTVGGRALIMSGNNNLIAFSQSNQLPKTHLPKSPVKIGATTTQLTTDGLGATTCRTEEEDREQGKVAWRVYREYAKSSNIFAVCCFCIALVSSQSSLMAANFWLERWTEANGRYQKNFNNALGIGVYFALGAGSVAFMVIQTLILWMFCSIEASKIIHKRMLDAVFAAPITFFETNPLGRILNRFSNDLYKIDEILARSFDSLFEHVAKAIFTLGLITTSTPIFALFILPISGVYFYYQRFFLTTSRELKRLNSVSKSPIYAHFKDTLDGLPTVRAYKHEPQFRAGNLAQVDSNAQTVFLSICANRWLAIRLEFIGASIILTAAVLAVVSVVAGGGPSAGMVGLAMSYTLQITQILNWIVRQSAEVETNILSVERCLEYSDLPSEEKRAHLKPPEASWPSQGAIEIKDYSAKYQTSPDLVLKRIDLRIEPHEKIGIVGRTGAGKSSLTLALLRMIECTSGSVFIDGVDIESVPLSSLRGRIALIPQDTTLFEGTLRANLDPRNEHDDTEIWDALSHVRLKGHISTMSGQLDTHIHEQGTNFSQGQRQLISLARALLTNAKILILDESTASIDNETEAKLQKLLRSSIFQFRTVITIAHRIHTIIDADRIVVMEKGAVAELGSPHNLMEKQGLFYDLVREAGHKIVD